MPGVKGRSGRRKQPTSYIKEALNNLTGDIPALLKQLKELALKGNPVICPYCHKEHPGIGKPDKDAIIYLCDRILGKPKQVQEIDITTTIQLSPEQLRRILERQSVSAGIFKAMEEPALQIDSQSKASVEDDSQ